MSQSFWFKAVGGLLAFAAAPIYCVWSLHSLKTSGLLHDNNVKKNIARSLGQRVDDEE